MGGTDSMMCDLARGAWLVMCPCGWDAKFLGVTSSASAIASSITVTGIINSQNDVVYPWIDYRMHGTRHVMVMVL